MKRVAEPPPLKVAGVADNYTSDLFSDKARNPLPDGNVAAGVADGCAFSGSLSDSLGGRGGTSTGSPLYARTYTRMETNQTKCHIRHLCHPERCPSCRAVTLGDCDPSPLTALGEAMAQLGGITTHQLIPATDGWQVAERTAELIEHLPAGGRVDVLPAHRCGRPTPDAQGATSVHACAEKLTKRSMASRWGAGGGRGAATPIRCVCGTWCLGGLDADLGAAWRLVEAYPVSELGRAYAVATGRRLALLTPLRDGVRLQHSWDPLPRSAAWHLWMADHRCRRPLPAAEIPDRTPETTDDPWRTNARLNF